MSEKQMLTLPGRLFRKAAQTPDVIALREKEFGVWREISWLEYAQQVGCAAIAMQAIGVEAGDHVAILSENRTEWLFADLAAQALGARSVGIYQTNPTEDVAYILNHSGAKVVFCEDQEQVDKVVEARANAQCLDSGGV